MSAHPPEADADGPEGTSGDAEPDTAPATFHGPPEPIRLDGDLVLAHPKPDGTDLATTTLTSLTCQRCGADAEAHLVNGELKPAKGKCPGCDRNGPFAHPVLDGGDVQTLAHACEQGIWRLPENCNDEGYEDLWDDVRAYIRDHWDTDDPTVYDGLTAFALSTWFREELDFLPHLMLMGKTTGGKTRMLNTLARVSYRAVVSASATAASLFRMIDRYNVTFYVSEYHGLQHDARHELDNVVRAGQKRGETVVRAEQTAAGYEPKVFDPFTHLAIATQYEPADDVVNRCLQVHSQSADRDMPAKLDEKRATALRDRLLYARFRLLESDEWKNAEKRAYAYLADRDIDGRPREKLLAFVTIASVFNQVDAIEPVVDMVVTQDETAAADSEDAVFVEAVRDLALDRVGNVCVLGDEDPFGAVEILLKDVVERFNDVTGAEKTSSWAGHVRNRLGLGKARRRDGTVITDPDLGPKLRQHCEDLGLPWEPTEAHDPAPPLPENDIVERACDECGEHRRLTHRDQDGDGARICGTCAEDIRAAVEERRSGAPANDRSPASNPRETSDKHSSGNGDNDGDGDPDRETSWFGNGQD